MSGAAINSSGTGHLRPTTAAAVAGNGVESDLLLGGVGHEELDEDYNNAGNDRRVDQRPNTAGAMMSGGFNRMAHPSQGSSWGYSRQATDPTNANVNSNIKTGSSGIADYGTDGPNSNRRPHTAHGARAGVSSSQLAGAGMYGAEAQKPSSLYPNGEVSG